MLPLFNLFLVIGMDMGFLAYIVGFLCLINSITTILFGLVVCIMTGAPIWVYAIWVICLIEGSA